MTTGRPATVLALAAFLASMFLVTSTQAAAQSKARIVRLSDVEGSVQIERSSSEGLEKAFLNMPVIEGSRLKTGDQGRAEIEFEDGSTVRIGGNTELVFTRLALADDGGKLNGAELRSGTFYANVHEKKGDQFDVSFGGESLNVPQAAHFRLVMEEPQRATVAVFKGSVSATGPMGKFEVAEKHHASIDLVATDATKENAFVVAKNYDQDPLDGWDRQQDNYHDHHAAVAAGGSGFSSPYGYGMSDLSYYGAFNMIPGYGFGWQPFFMDAAWNPFMDGAWAFYPGFGYLWVSGYPWGWMPYNYGMWGFAPGYGWYWQPGGWNKFSGTPRVVNAPPGLKLPVAPTGGHQTLLVGRGLMSITYVNPGKLTIRPGSAGFGVPRGSVNHLDHTAKAMEHNARPVTVSTVRPAESQGSGFGGGVPGHGASSGRMATAAPTHSSGNTGGARSGPHK
ncbi:MAG TPA: FecR family protein [Terriglobales bacterium]|nr:FecR family protein [Terriglobales bacterium]